jgi:hypothetical protein
MQRRAGATLRLGQEGAPGTIQLRVLVWAGADSATGDASAVGGMRMWAGAIRQRGDAILW